MVETVKVRFTNCHSTQLFISKSGWGGGTNMHIHDSPNFKSRRESDINIKNVESLWIELISKNSKKPIYRPADGDFMSETCEHENT